MDINLFKQFIREERPKKMLSPFELAYKSFDELGFTTKDRDYFFQNASLIVEEVRAKSWEKFLLDEGEFSSYVYEQLIDKNAVEKMSKVEAIKWFTSKFTDHIYALSLSNTQSRRSRAGNEFETIIELILMGAGIPFDTQGSIGSGIFESSHLAKMVDCVSPGASEYRLDKRNTSLISAKTTLRERWQEVGDEMARTMAREMYLATLDDNISQNVIQLIGKNNIILVTTKDNKETLYKSSPYVISFERMIEELKTKSMVWESYVYPEEELNDKIKQYKIQIEKFEDKPFVANYYKEQIDSLR